ncbi:T9SS type A sorting domain-containing protein [Bacteroidota bacterium]
MVTTSLLAQPMHYNYTTGSGNTFPLGQTNGKFVNWLFLPGAFNTPTPCPPGQEITKVYVRMYGTGTRTYTNLHILMAQTTLTNLTSGQFYAGPWDTVFVKDTSLTSAGAGTWLGIKLHTPYPYDPTKALVVGIGQCGGAGSGMYVLQTAITGVKRTWSISGCPFVPYSGGDTYNLDMGIDVQLSVPHHYNYNTTGGPNSFPFNMGPGKRIQTLIKAGDFNQPNSAPTGILTHFYVKISTYPLGPATYTGLNIKMGQITATSLPASFIPLTDIVYQRNTVTLTAAAGTWLEFELDTPFEYDSAKSLVVEIEQCGVTGTFSGYSLAHTTGLPITGNGRSYSTTVTCVAPYQGLTTGRVVNCGVNVTPMTGVITPVSNIPEKYSLSQNNPNPFNPTTKIDYQIPKSGLVTLRIFDLLGREVATLVNEEKASGSYTIEFNGSNISSGTYFYRMESGTFIETKKMMLMK